MPYRHEESRQEKGRLAALGGGRRGQFLLMVLTWRRGRCALSGWAYAKATSLAHWPRDKFDKANVRSKGNSGRAKHGRGAVAFAQANIGELKVQIKRLDDQWKKEAEARRKGHAPEGFAGQHADESRCSQAGANNTVEIEMDNKQPGQALPALNARVIDTTNNQVFYNRALDTKNGQNNFNFELPRDLPVVPGNNLALEVISEGEKDAPASIRERITLAAPEYVTHLFTDRPMYRPGETIYFRSLTLERFSLKPAQEDLRLRFRITGPQRCRNLQNRRLPPRSATGQNEPLLKGPDDQPLGGIGAGEFRIPPEVPGGQYTLSVAETSGRFPIEKRTFLINQWQAPRFNKEITFDRATYGPGDAVEISALGVPAEGGGPGNPLVATMTVTVDGQRIPWFDQRLLRRSGRPCSLSPHHASRSPTNAAGERHRQHCFQ